ncbi:MAG: AMP-binding protein [Bacteroidota bacterium]
MLKISSCIHKHPPIWGKESPGRLALIEPESGRQLMYRQLVREIDEKAMRLLHLGVRPGDRVLSLLPLQIDQVILLYACAKIGAIFVPLDHPTDRELFANRFRTIDPKVVFFPSSHKGESYKDIARVLSYLSSPDIFLIQYYTESKLELDSALSWEHFCKSPTMTQLKLSRFLNGSSTKAQKEIHAWSPLLLYFLPGTDKGVLLCHENILSQTANLHYHTQLHREMKVLVNQSAGSILSLLHGVCSTLTLGATAVLSECKGPLHTLGLMENYCISYLIQQPEQYQQIWEELPPQVGQHPFLQYALYPTDGNRAFIPDEDFYQKMGMFAQNFGTGLFLPEAGGFISFSSDVMIGLSPNPSQVPFEIRNEHMLLSIREPMHPGGKCGSPLSMGEIGQLCVHPPNVFLGYFQQHEETGKILSKEGVLYSHFYGTILKNRNQNLLYLAKHQPALKVPKLLVAPLAQ